MKVLTKVYEGIDKGLWCASAHCDACSEPYKTFIIQSCCAQEKTPKPISFFKCKGVLSSGPGISFSDFDNLPENTSDWCTNQPAPTCPSADEDLGSSSSNNGGSSSSGINYSSSSGTGGSSGSGGDPDDDYFLALCQKTAAEIEPIYESFVDGCIASGGRSAYQKIFMGEEHGHCIVGECEYPDDEPESFCRATTAELKPEFEKRVLACSANGGEQAYSMAYVGGEHGFCIVGECKYPDDGEPVNTCRATAGELTDTMRDLIIDCRKGNPENGYSYNIEYFKNNPPESLFCITGKCNFSENSSSSSGASSGSSPGAGWCAMHPESVCCPGGGARNCECGHGTSLGYRLADASGICDYGNQVWRCSLDPASSLSGGRSPCTDQSRSSSNSNALSSSSSSIGSSSSSNVDIYEFCKENPSDVNCFGYGENSSSSKAAYSSSSQATAAKHNEPGPNAIYTVNDCFSSGLDNMEPGKCYGLNPDRGIQYGWINSNAQDRWWWEERACDCSALAEPVTPGGCKNNARGANAVYTVDDCFSSGLDYMEPGKCYSLNPSRGTQYGWISNDARDRWWWVEVSCGGGNEGSNGCPPSNSFLQKKSMFEKDSENSNEDISYEVWGNKTRLFYDALGRKTQARPETRRYLFLPKKKMLNYEQDSWLSGSTSFMLKTSIDGFVNAKHYANIAIQSTEISSSNSKLSYANVLLILSTEINRIVDQNDPNLIRHENKHIEIYNNLGNRQWNTTVPFNGCSSVEEQCSDIKEKAWQEIERQFRLMIQAQNKWDDDDKNNVSHERINEEGKVKELKGELEKNYKCGNKK